MTNRVEFRSVMGVRHTGTFGDDGVVADAARVSTARDQQKRPIEGLLRYLLANNHESPTEHISLSFILEIPIFVARELVRHRIGIGFNESSGRFAEMRPLFYIPAPDRLLVREPGSNPAKPSHVLGSAEQYEIALEHHMGAARDAWNRYEILLQSGISNEVARNVLPVSIYTRIYWTPNIRALIHFLDLRLASNALQEIRELSLQLEEVFKQEFPVTHAAWLAARSGGVR